MWVFGFRPLELVPVWVKSQNRVSNGCDKCGCDKRLTMSGCGGDLGHDVRDDDESLRKVPAPALVAILGRRRLAKFAGRLLKFAA